MDVYLTKPVVRRELVDALDRLRTAGKTGAAPVPAPLPPPVAPSTSKAFDPAKILHEVEGDEALVLRLMQLFLEATPPLVADLRFAIQSSDHKQVEFSAHAIKSSLLALGAVEAADCALILEKMGNRAETENLNETFKQFETLINGLMADIRRRTEAGIL